MKNISLIVIGVFLCFESAFAETTAGHIPITHSHPDTDPKSICWGYAQGRAFGKQPGDAECDPRVTYAERIYETWFAFVSGSGLTNITVGDIVVFGEIRAGLSGHAAYVVEIPSPFNINNIKVDQVPNQGGVEQRNVLLSTVMQTQGTPVGYHKGYGGGQSAQTVLLTFVNSFGSGDMHIGKNKTVWNTELSGFSRNYYVGSQLEIEAIDGQVSIENGISYVQRYQSWTPPVVGDFTANPVTIPITHSGTYRANFRKQFNIVLSNTVLVEPGTGSSYKVNSSDVGQSWSGTRLQGVPMSIEAIPPVPTGNWTLIKWSDGITQNPRQLPDNHVSVSALFKRYQASSYPDATGYNNQRKLVAHTLGGTTVHHLVYESGGDIWYATSTSGGAWTAEVLVSDGSGNNHNPSIDVYNVGSYNIYVHIVWVNTANATVYFRERHSYLGNWTWKPVEAVPVHPVNEPTPGYNPISWTPVISHGYVAYNRYHSGGSGGAIVVKNRWSQNNWMHVGLVPGTGASSKNPSIAYDDLGYCNVAYENSAGGTIHYNRTIHQGGGYYAWGSDEQVSPVGWQYNSHPSLTLIATGGGTPAVAWQSWNNVVSCGSSVHVRPKFNGWGAVQSYSYSYQTDIRPSIGGLKDTYSMAVIWSNNGTITSGTYANYSWSAPTVIASGSDGGALPNATVIAETPYNSRVVWRKANWPLSYASTGILGGGEGGPKELLAVMESSPFVAPSVLSADGAHSNQKELAYRWTRQGLVDLASASEMFVSRSGKSTLPPQGMIVFELQKLQYGEQLINYSVARDSDLVSDKPWLFTSDPFVITSSGRKLALSGTLYGKNLYLPKNALPNGSTPLAVVSVVEAETKQPIRTIANIPVSRLAHVEESSFSDSWRYEFDPAGLEGKEVYVQVSMLGESIGIYPVIVDDYLITEGAEHQAGQQDVREKGELEIPSGFALHQNFPNPFNPETKISFELKEAGHVRLAIYDMLGREVVELADHHHSVGLHAKNWNAEGFGSGVFVYRLTFIGENGTIKTTSRKMVVAK